MLRLSDNGPGLSIQKAIPAFILLLTFMLSIVIFQDFLHSKRNSYSFYFSESLLFNTFWILFFPVSCLQFCFFRKTAFLTKLRSNYIRMLLFVSSASVLHIGLFSISVFSLSAIFFDHTYSITHNLDYTIAHDLYKYQFIYGAVAFFHFRKGNPAQKTGPGISQALSHRLMDKIIIGTGRSQVAVATEDIILICSSNPYIAIHTQGKKYLHTETLRSILEKLDGNKFARIHKSTIINLEKVVSYKSRLNGDYDILLTNQQEVRLSRNYVRSFRQHFENTSSP